MSQTQKQPVKGEDRRFAKARGVSLMILISICSAQLLLIAGCHRGFYRRQADAEAKRLIQQKKAARWDSATGDIEIDPMSRMFDPFSADHPPLPPDDPESHKLMNQVDCKPGYPHWHANGDINSVESPDWRAFLPVNEKGELVLSLSDAYRLALIHSPDLQQQRETLYLSALEVSIQRFGFDSQLFAGFNSFLTTRGRFQSGTGQSSTTLESSLGSTGGGITARRLGITGANFVVGLANTILWEFAGNNTQSANSLINFSLIQPLLRGAGRERILESLTQAERTLLANVRQLERFRRGFYLEIATGRNAGLGPSQNSAAFLSNPAFGNANVGGYIGLLQQKQQIKNTEFSVAQFEDLLFQFNELFRLGRLNALNAAQFEGRVYTQQQLLLSQKIAYKNALDRFKVSIGLPQDVNIVIEDPFLDAFNLIDDRFPEQLQDIKELRDVTSQSVVGFAIAANQRREMEQTGENLDAINKVLKTRTISILPFLKRGEKLVDSILEEDRALVAKDIAALEQAREGRLQYLAKVARDIESGKLESRVESKVFTNDSIPDTQRLMDELSGENNKLSLVSLLQNTVDEIRDGIELLEDFEASDSEELNEETNAFLTRIPDLLNEVNGIVLEMALLQAEARANVVEITDVSIESESAFETARCLRRDWMNARAALVDRWRQIEFFADQLESQVDLVLTGEIGNANADNPFRIRYEDGNLRAGFRFDAPIVRQVERNTYRQAQIAYQQSRRSYYQFEDSIHQSLRLTLRTINQNKVLFELNRNNLQNQITQVKLNRARLVQPPAVGQRVSQSDTTATFLADAIQNFSTRQNQYLSQWTQYEVLRRNLDFDMGTMQLDENFEWIDPGEIDATIGSRVAMLEGVAENDRFCCGMNSSQMETQFVTPADGMSSSDNEIIEQPPVESDAPQLQYEGDSIEIDTQEEIETPKPPANLTEPTDDETLTLPLGKKKFRAKPESASTGASSVSAKGSLDPFRRRAPVNDQQKKLIATKDDKTVGLISVTPSTEAVSSVFDATAPSAREVLKQRTAKELDVKIRRR